MDRPQQPIICWVFQILRFVLSVMGVYCLTKWLLRNGVTGTGSPTSVASGAGSFVGVVGILIFEQFWFFRALHLWREKEKEGKSIQPEHHSPFSYPIICTALKWLRYGLAILGLVYLMNWTLRSSFAVADGPAIVASAAVSVVTVVGTLMIEKALLHRSLERWRQEQLAKVGNSVLPPDAGSP